MEGDDQQDPIVDTVRSLLDGHIVLDRNLALRNHYPPISVLESLSRLMPSVTSPEHRDKAGALRTLIAAHHQAEDLVRIGAYQKGTDPVLDKAIAALPEINRFLRQTPSDRTSMNETLQQLFALPC
jgi:flagellum-specific ATP synthase